MIWSTAKFLTLCLFACQFAMMLLAVFYLRRRKLSGIAYLLWGVLAISLPLIGPYLVISSQPGELSTTLRG